MNITSECQVSVSQKNSINKFTVQGEENSRVLTLHLVENVSTENVRSLQQIEIRKKPLDLAGCTVRLYVKKPDGNATFTDGTIVETGADGNPNTVTFVLTQQTLAAAGNAHCTVAVFGQNGTVLKATGITLDIAADDMEQTIVSTSEFVSLAEALNKAESAEKIAEDSAAEVNQTVSAASTELQSLKTQSSDITAAETARVDAEGKRVTAESDRVAAEGKRQTAETARGEAEAQRTNNESTRQATEAARAAAESSRASEESKRVTAESSRADAETVRATAEQARQTAESGRQTAETARESASQTAVNSADAATIRANTAAKAAEGVVAGDLLIDKPDGTAGYNRLYIDDVQTVARDTKTTIPAMRTIDTQPTFKLYGYSHQDGVPTPENPIDPVSLQSPLKVTIGTTDYSIPLTASDTTTYPDPLELHSLPTVTDAIINDYAILRSRKFTFNGTEHKWYYASGTFNLPDDTSYNYAVFVSYDLTVIDNMLCDKFIYKPYDHGFYQDATSESISGGGGYRLVFIRIAKSRLTGWSETWTSTQKVTAFKTWLAANPVTIIYQLITPLTIPLSSDTQTALNNLRTAIAPLASGKALTVTSDAPMDIISRGKFHQQQEQIDSNAANIADNQLSFAAQAAQQEIEIKKIKEQTTPFTKVTGNADMDALSTTGIYGIATSSYTNGPPGVTNHGLLIVDKNGDGTQTFLPDSTVSSVYRRVGHSDGTWGAWVQGTLMSPDDVTRLKSTITKSQADTYYSGKIKKITAMLSTTWTNKTQDITVAGVTPTSTIAIQPADSATADQRGAWRSAMISSTCGDGKITLTADGDEPTAGIPLTVTIWG